MKCLTIQIEINRLPGGNVQAFEEAEFLKRVHSVNRYPEIDRPELGKGDYHNDFISYNFFTAQLPELWQQLQQVLIEDTDYFAILSPIAIIACEGEQGWDDYRLLYHFDPGETTVSI